MYNFNLDNDEKIIEVFEGEYVKQGEKEKNTTIAITTKRILFMEFDYNDSNESLRVGRGIDFVRYKEIYYQINRKDIVSIKFNDDLYKVLLEDNTEFEFENDKIYELLK